MKTNKTRRGSLGLVSGFAVSIAMVGMAAPLLAQRTQEQNRQNNEYERQDDHQRSRDRQSDSARRGGDRMDLEEAKKLCKVLKQGNIDLAEAVKKAEREKNGTAIFARANLSGVAMDRLDSNPDRRNARTDRNQNRDRDDQNRDDDSGDENAVVTVQLATDQDPARIVLVSLKNGTIMDSGDHPGYQGDHPGYQGEHPGSHGEHPGSHGEHPRDQVDPATRGDSRSERRGSESTQQGARVATRVFKANQIIGANVKNPKDENLGEIADLAIDPSNGRIVYAVLSFGGFLGMGDKLFAVPWAALDDQPDDTYILSVDKDRLKNAPGFDKSSWPKMADRRWGETIHSFYGQRPYWEDHGERRTESTDRRSTQPFIALADARTIRRTLDSGSTSISDAIQKAERHANGKAVAAKCIIITAEQKRQLASDEYESGTSNPGRGDDRNPNQRGPQRDPQNPDRPDRSPQTPRTGGDSDRVVVTEVCCLVERSPEQLVFVTVGAEDGKVLATNRQSLEDRLGISSR